MWLTLFDGSVFFGGMVPRFFGGFCGDFWGDESVWKKSREYHLRNTSGEDALLGHPNLIVIWQLGSSDYFVGIA